MCGRVIYLYSPDERWHEYSKGARWGCIMETEYLHACFLRCWLGSYDTIIIFSERKKGVVLRVISTKQWPHSPELLLMSLDRFSYIVATNGWNLTTFKRSWQLLRTQAIWARSEYTCFLSSGFSWTCHPPHVSRQIQVLDLLLLRLR